MSLSFLGRRCLTIEQGEETSKMQLRRPRRRPRIGIRQCKTTYRSFNQTSLRTRSSLRGEPRGRLSFSGQVRIQTGTKSSNANIHRFDLFLKYQTKIHKEDVSKWKTKDFQRFLCSGIKRSPASADSKEKKLGSWHQCYRLDGKLIAVAVLDLMPSSVSSVYVL